jgi:hypothetical protein
MPSNLGRYKKDLESLIAQGHRLHAAMVADYAPEAIKGQLKKELGSEKRSQDYIKALPSFRDTYQIWYSEAKSLIKQILPDRLSDLVRLYEKPKPRKAISYENYSIEDYLNGLRVTGGYPKEVIVGPEAAIPKFVQQQAILASVKARFESSLFEIRQLVQADLFDSELEVAKELAKNKFTRAAGAVAGVVLERHLTEVCGNHAINIAKKTPVISDLTDALKSAAVIDVPQWRFIQHLADIRNLCDHNKVAEPTMEQVSDLIEGVGKTTKTLF